jgi:hypothetical protein
MAISCIRMMAGFHEMSRYILTAVTKKTEQKRTQALCSDNMKTGSADFARASHGNADTNIRAACLSKGVFFQLYHARIMSISS